MRTGGLNADSASVGTLARVRRLVRVFTASVLVLSVGCGGHAKEAKAQAVDCAAVKCVALTFDDGPGRSPIDCSAFSERGRRGDLS